MTDERKRRKKIIQIIARLNVGGPAVHVTMLTGHFSSAEWQSQLLTGMHGANEGDMTYLAEQYGIKPLVLKGFGREISLWNDLRVIRQLYLIMCHEKPDIVCTHTAKAGTLGRLAAVMARVPRVYHTFHGHIFHGYFSPLKTRFYILMEKILARISTSIIAISERQKQELVSYGITKADKIRVISLGLDFSRMLPCDPDRSLATRLGVGPKVTTVALVGRITAIKAPSLFIMAAQEVLKQRNDVHFLMIGDGELKNACQAEVENLGLQRHFSFTGFVADLKLLYGSVDIVCLTSVNEGTPVSLLEAMACGKLVVSTPVGGVPDFVTDGVNGFLCPAEPHAFAARISAFVEDPGKYQNVREQASRDIQRKYSRERLFKDYERLFSE